MKIVRRLPGSFLVKDEFEKRKLLDEVLTPHRTTLVCGKHQYVGSGVPPLTKGCPDCWQVYFVHMIASTPPAKREEKLEELEEIVHKLVELQEKNQLDFKPYHGPNKVSIEEE